MSLVSKKGEERPKVATKIAFLMITMTVLLWSISVVVGKGLHEEIPLIGLTFWRWIIALFFLAPFVWREIYLNIDIVCKYWRIYLAQGIFMVGGGTLLFTSLYFTSAINAALVNTTQPAITALLAWIVLKDRLKNIQYAGIASAIAGVIFMIIKADFKILINLDFNIGDFIVVLAITSYSMYAINLRNLPSELGTFSSLFLIIFFGSFPLLPFYIGETILIKPFPFTLESCIWASFLAVIISIGSIALWNTGNRSVGPQRAAVFVSLMPIFGSVLAITFLGENLYFYHLIGSFFICSGIFMVVRNH
jgi:drug/metabolite transporter (DMT)-like permease